MLSYAGTGFATLTGNTVHDLTSASANPTLSGGATAVQGILYTGTSTAGGTVSQNTVYAIACTNATAVQTAALGIGYSNPTAGRVTRNRIYDIRNASTMTTTTTPPVAGGIMLRAFATSVGGLEQLCLARNITDDEHAVRWNLEFIQYHRPVKRLSQLGCNHRHNGRRSASKLRAVAR